MGECIYKVGGCVRDAILGVPCKDIDYVCVFPSYSAMVEYIGSVGKIYLESPQYQTVRAHLPGTPAADFVLARRDGEYTDGRRPDSVSVGTLLDDLSRRDFTMNAIAQDSSGAIIDPFGGVNDIRNKIIRCVGDPMHRFYEDSLRILRAIRFSITKGFRISESVLCCMQDSSLVARLANVSQERIREELTKCFSFDTLATLRVLQGFPEIRDICFSGGIRLLPTTKRF